MIVIADTTPINYLVLIEHIDVLVKLYAHIIIPSMVRDELLSEQAPVAVRQWIANPPHWLEVRTPSPTSDPVLVKLDPGERDAITLAEELAADQLIIDELIGRRVAERRGLPIVGTIGVLREGAQRGFLDIKVAVERLRQTNIHIAPEMLDQLLRTTPPTRR